VIIMSDRMAGTLFFIGVMVALYVIGTFVPDPPWIKPAGNTVTTVCEADR
jgi:hypothetical protein